METYGEVKKYYLYPQGVNKAGRTTEHQSKNPYAPVDRWY